jgi:hypothetical protein
MLYGVNSVNTGRRFRLSLNSALCYSKTNA